MCGVKKGNALTGQDLTAKTPNQDTQESNFIPKDNALGGFQTLAFGGGKVIGIKAMLGQRLMALGTALVCLDGTQLECVGVTGLAAHQCVRHGAEAECVRFSVPPRFLITDCLAAITAFGAVVMLKYPFVVWARKNRTNILTN